MESIRKQWIKGVKKVVTAPQGAKVVLATSNVIKSNSPDAIPVRIVKDPDAPSIGKLSYDETHPYRQKELIIRLKEELKGEIDNAELVNPRLILCLRRLYNLDQNQDFYYKPAFGSPQYSEDLVQWVKNKLKSNSNFIEEAKKQCFDKRFELGFVSKTKKKS